MTIETFAYRTDELRLKWRKTCELTLTHPIHLTPYAPVSQKIADQR